MANPWDIRPIEPSPNLDFIEESRRLFDIVSRSLQVPQRILQVIPMHVEPSDDEKTFIRAFWLAPYGDALPRLYYADWLDEHDKPAAAQQARKNQPPYYCSCSGTGAESSVKRILVCSQCDGRGERETVQTIIAPAPAPKPWTGVAEELRTYTCYRRDETQCRYCDGKGSIVVRSVCSHCDGRWLPPDCNVLKEGDPVWFWLDSLHACKTRPKFQGDLPVGRFIAFDPDHPEMARIGRYETGELP